MKAIMVMYDSLNRRYLEPYGSGLCETPNFRRLAQHSVRFTNCFVGSMPCMPARRELHTGRYNFLHRSWGPIEPFDDSVPELLKMSGVYTHLCSDHQHYWEDGGATYHSRYNSFEFARGQEGDPWKGQIADPDTSGVYDPTAQFTAKMAGRGFFPNIRRQDAVNRQFLQNEVDMPQAVTFSNGLDFIDRNHLEDNWFLQIEAYDPHEPFFASERFRAMFPDPDDVSLPEFDWPSYGPVTESAEMIEHCRNRYKALITMCDFYLGKVLDAMDRYDLWKDTMLIVNTDHGYLLGEHGYWAKLITPYYNEIAHIPLFVWDPRFGHAGETRRELVQNIDVAATLLEFFGQPLPGDMQGRPIRTILEKDEPIHDSVLFGSHGVYLNVTDGKYIYMRMRRPGTEMYDYTLMPTHMRARFSPEELRDAELSGPFSFTKGCRVLKIPAGAGRVSGYPDLLFDHEADPNQLSPIDDPETEVRMINLLREGMISNDAPAEVFDAYAIPRDREFLPGDLRDQRGE